ncbi:glycoside hydrolase family 31 protein [Meiothermus taiwanensis]|uniref:Alpha-glucosidase n=2 Tax=Meiothermus taiwanensis TaxID=172827 RepID=A0ABN5LWA5_9DEIN|nr:glycoside hydrolase family 31 protein [Meiothermus taiwanensis]AWR86143.1 alpha-glucosidase [Meiothermus taiwanensis WR-220]KIQ53851.1 alpha-glucosidase [Meiothermus taiwanensis]
MNELLNWDIPFDRMERLALEGGLVQARVEQVEHEGLRAWRLLLTQRPRDAAKEGPAVQGVVRRQPEKKAESYLAEGLSPLVLGEEGLGWGGLELAFWGCPHREVPPVLRLLADGVPYPLLALSFPLGAARYLGLGERVGGLERRGGRYWNFTADQPPRPGRDPLYQASPLLLRVEGARAWGLLLDESYPSLFDLGYSHPAEARLAVAGPTLDLYLLEGSLLEVVAGLTRLTGRPPMPPLWALGYHQCRYSYADEASVREVVEQFAAHGLPLEAVWLDIHYMDGYKVFTASPQRFPRLALLAEELSDRGVRLVPIVDPGVKVEEGYSVFEEGMRRQAFIRDDRDELLVGGVWPRRAVWPDFSREEVRAFWAEEVEKFARTYGFAGIWNDMNEPAVLELGGAEPPDKALPLTARQGAKSHLEARNLYALGMAEATYRGLQALGRRPFILTRSGFPGIQRYAFVWTGDNESRYEDLALSVPMLLSLGLSGIPLAGSDVGGFGLDAEPELLLRWMWLGALYPFFRNHSALGTRRQEPYAFGEPWTTRMREALHFRYRLLPYLYSLARTAHEEGLPLLRPLGLYWPEDAAAWRDDQFLLGEALLAAPVLRKGARAREIYLPPGGWQDFWNGERLEGASLHRVAAPLERLPLFQRAGTAIPLTEARYPTRTARWPFLCFRVALGPKVRGRVFEDAGEGGDEGAWSELEGGFDGRRLELLFTDRSGHARQGVLAEVWGVAPPTRGQGYAYHNGLLRLDVQGGGAWVAWD